MTDFSGNNPPGPPIKKGGESSGDDIKKIAKGASISFIGGFLGRFTSFLCQVIIARFFGTEVFGLYVLGLIIVRITELIARFGLHTGAMRFISIYRNDSPERVKGTFISASFISFINGILLGTIIYIFAWEISAYIFHKPELTDTIKTFALCVPFMAAMMVIATASQGFHSAKYSVYIKDIIQPSINIGLIIIFIQSGFGIIWIVNAFLISHVIALIAGVYFISKQCNEISERTIKPYYETKKLLSFSLPFLFHGFLYFLISWTDIIMLGYMKETADVGIYRAASQVPALLTMFLMSANTMYVPAIAEMHYLNQIGRMGKIFKTTTRWVFSLTLPVALLLIFSAKDVMAIFGPDYITGGASVLVVLSVAQFINCVTGGVGFTLSMTGKQYLEMYNSIAMVLINIVLNYFLIPEYGAMGAAIATSISIIAINLVRLAEVYIFYKIHPYSTDYFRGIICGVVAVIVLLIIGRHLPSDSHLIMLFINSLVIAIIFVAGFSYNGFNEEDRLLFAALSDKFKIKSTLRK